MKPPSLKSIRLKNFKAVQDSGIIKLTPLTVFIGNNGSGKSSIIEGLETLQTMLEHGLDRAMQSWRGFEHVWHQGVLHRLLQPGHVRSHHSNPMSFDLTGRIRTGAFSASLRVNMGPGANELFIEEERVVIRNHLAVQRDAHGKVTIKRKNGRPQQYTNADGEAELGKALDRFPLEWQFVSLVAQSMGAPGPQHRTGGQARLNKEGVNLADYLLSIRKLDQQAFDGIVETLQHVLPYAKDLQPALTSELERTVYLQLTEADFKVPGWLLSTGTLRILAFLALFRHPTPPPLIVIEEIENGLDPRTLHLLVDEIRTLVESGRSQVIVTTHSPYLLDLLDLSHIVMVERIDGQPTFTRPANEAALKKWAKDFSPGRLYTMGMFNQKKKQRK
jgi:predicted ATPase